MQTSKYGTWYTITTMACLPNGLLGSSNTVWWINMENEWKIISATTQVCCCYSSPCTQHTTWIPVVAEKKKKPVDPPDYAYTFISVSSNILCSAG